MSYGSLLESLTRDRGRAVDRVLLAAAQVAALAWFAPRTPGLPLDDAWIHQVVARTFAETGTLGYAPGQHGAAATSYLWAALLAVNFVVVHARPETWSLVLAGGSTLASGQLLYGLFTRATPEGVEPFAWRLASLGATAAAMLGGHALWFAHSGMEASMLVALSLAAITLATRARADQRAALWAGVLAGLLALLRPEAAALGGLLLLEEMLREKKVTPRHVRLGVPWIAALAIYIGSNVVKTGHAMPATLSGRRWLWFEPSAGLSHLEIVGEQAVVWLDRLRDYAVGHERLSLLWVGLGLAAYGIYRLLRDADTGVKLLLGWAAFHTLFYVVMLPTPGHGGRYQPFVPLLYAACAVLGGAFVLWELVRRAQALLALAAALPWLVSAYYGSRELRDRNDLAVLHIESTELAMGRRIDALPPDAVVASFDIGGIGWATKKRVLDLGGLSDPAVASQLERGLAWKWLAAQHVDYVVLPEAYDDELPDVVGFAWRLHLRDNDAVKLEPIATFESKATLWLPAAEATWNSAPRQVLHRVTYTGKDGPRVPPVVSPAAKRPIVDPGSLAPLDDRARAEHELAILEAWGLPVDVVIAAERPKAAASVCRVAVGGFGVVVDACDLGPASLIVTEQVRRYVDIGDYGGAFRMIPHAIARAKRRTDRGFFPALAPVVPPMVERPFAAVRASLPSGVPLAIATLALALALPWMRRRGVAALASVAVLASACRGEPGLLEAAGSGDARTVDRARGDLERRGPSGRTALLVAAERGDAEIVARLIARGAKTDVTDEWGATALHLCARRGASECVALLARTVAPEAVDVPAGPRERTALVDATHGGVDGAAVRALIAAGASPRRPGSDGETALHGVAVLDAARSAELAAVVLDSGADPLQPDDRGFTALHAAAALGNVALATEIVHRPLLRLALFATSPLGENAYDVALRYRQDRVAQLLFQAGADARSAPPLVDASRMNDVPRLAALLATGADPSKAWEGKTALEVAHERGSKEAAALLEAAVPKEAR